MFRNLILALLRASPAAAHGLCIGPNGGMRVDAGPYQVEPVPAATIVNVHVTLGDEGTLDTSAMRGTAILLIDGKPVCAPPAPTVPGFCLPMSVFPTPRT